MHLPDPPQVDLSAQVAKVQYNKDQLEAAPDFKTQEAKKAESEAAQQQQSAPASAPATTPPASTD